MAIKKGTTYGLLVALTIFTIVFSSMVLAYAGGVNSRGSDELKKFDPSLRKWLIGISAVMLALAVAVLVVASLQFTQRPSLEQLVRGV
jgi:hypothetical protein